MEIIHQSNSRCDGEIILSQEPAKRRVIWCDKTAYYLSFPQIFFKLDYAYSKTKYDYWFKSFSLVFFSENKLYIPPLYNVCGSLSMCLGESGFGHPTVESLTKKYVNAFWQNRFSTDIHEAMDFYRNEKTLFTPEPGFGRGQIPLTLNIPTKWEKRTRNNLEWTPDETNLVEVDPASAYKIKSSWKIESKFKD